MRFNLLAMALLCIPRVAFAVDADDTSPGNAYVLTVRARPDIQPETLSALAKIATMAQTTIAHSTSVRSFLREHYGSSLHPVRKIFAEYNGQKDVLEVGTVVQLPFAPLWRDEVKTTLPRHLTVASLAQILMGTSGNTTIKEIAKRNNVSPSALRRKREGTVTLPYVAVPVSYEVRSATPATVTAMTATLERLKRTDDALEVAEVTPRFRLTETFALASVQNCSSAPFGSGTQCEVKPESVVGSNPRLTVAVIDSGITANDGRFKYWQNQERPAGEATALSDLYGDVETIGVSFTQRGQFPVDNVAAARNHGTHVAGIATCRLGSTQLKTVLDRWLQLMALKVAKDDGFADPAAIADAVAYANFHHAEIVNMSLEGPPSLNVRSAMLADVNRTVFVAAAGNTPSGGRDLDVVAADQRPYPAAFSGTLPNVISVAAHDARYELACRSNFGARTVDIAAPGVEIVSTIQGTTGPLSGTSQAAPFVAYAAGLLKERGITSPKDVRNRLMYSADFKRGLRGRVRCDGALNIAKALAFDKDIVVTVSGSTLMGDLIGPASLRLTTTGGAHKDVPLRDVGKIINGYEDAPGQRVKVFCRNGDVGFSDTPLGDIVMRQDANTQTTIRSDDVVEIVPRL